MKTTASKRNLREFWKSEVVISFQAGISRLLEMLCAFFSVNCTYHVCPLVAFHVSHNNFCPHHVFHMNSLLPL